jgi:8-oxo-dGTP pyrophosphatase MutT (NUDIX family)
MTERTGSALTRNPKNLREFKRPIASLIIISSDDRILMGRKDPLKGGVYPNAWHIPGGGVDDGESLEAAARREAREEVGVDLTDEVLVSLPFVWHGESPKTLAVIFDLSLGGYWI